MKIIDTHTHIYVQEFYSDIDDVINKAKSVGVEKVLLPNIDMDTIGDLNRTADRFPDYCLPMMGLHPTSVDKDWAKNLALIKEYFNIRKYYAVGEIGGDLYWDKQYEVEQKLALNEQLRWSIELDLPVSLHSRNAIREVIRSIKEVGAGKLRGSFHSFGGNADELREVLKLDNFMIGVNGVVTFKNSTLDTVLKETDLSRIIIETDAPFLSPVPYRGKRNEPSYTPLIVMRLAEIFGKSPEEVGEITTENAKKLFNIEN